MVHFWDAFRLCLGAPILALLAVSADQVTLLRADGQRFTAALSLFPETDQERIREQFAGITDEPSAVDARIAALNALFEAPLFGDTDLWNSSPENIQEALIVGLTILPTEVADARGRAQWTSGHVLRERMRRDLLKNDFGDVLVQNLPMVDQGPRGYCVPATFERVLRMRTPAPKPPMWIRGGMPSATPARALSLSPSSNARPTSASSSATTASWEKWRFSTHGARGMPFAGSLMKKCAG